MSEPTRRIHIMFYVYNAMLWRTKVTFVLKQFIQEEA